MSNKSVKRLESKKRKAEAFLNLIKTEQNEVFREIGYPSCVWSIVSLSLVSNEEKPGQASTLNFYPLILYGVACYLYAILPSQSIILKA